MITEEAFNGGARYTISAVSLSLYRNSEKAQRIKNTSASAITISLPVVDLGRSFYIFNESDSSGNLTVAGTTVLPGKLAVASYSGSWRVSIRTVGTARNASSYSTSSPIEEVVVDPNCFEGTDCELAFAYGNKPLDGLGCRPMVVAPMFQNPCVAAKNEGREPIRGADYVMPSVVVVKFRDEFEEDTNHPSSGTYTLSPAFFTSLINNDKSHQLEYDLTLSVSGASRHPHHIRWNGAGWELPALTVQRHVWKRSVPYTATDGTTKNLEIRYVMEHTASSQPVVIPSYNPPSDSDSNISQSASKTLTKADGWNEDFEDGMLVNISGFTGGGYNGQATIKTVIGNVMTFDCGDIAWADDDAGEFVTVSAVNGGAVDGTKGAWGAVFHIYVFSDELSPTFTDGSGFTPLGAAAPITFTKADPFVWGGSVGENDEEKFAHPQLCLVAHGSPTTFQSPCGSNYVPWIDRATLTAGLRGRNRAYCYEVSNGAPWSTCETGRGPATDVAGIRGNVTFGYSSNSAAMTLGGDVPSSKPMEYVTFENGLAEGRTFLKPSRAGWDEACGLLTPEEGSSASITVCDDTLDGEEWPHFLVNSCRGNPQEPFEGVGGTHYCFHNNGPGSDDSRCCISIMQQFAGSKEVCVKTTTVYGDEIPFGPCELLDPRCSSNASYTTNLAVEVEDYDYQMNGNPNNRAISWLRYKQHPDQIIYNYEYSASEVTDLVQEKGAWTFGTNIDVTATGSAPVRSLVLYEPASWAARDMRTTVRILKATQASHFLAVRANTITFGAVDGYFGVLTPTGGTNATIEIKKYVDDVVTTLETINVTDYDDDTVDADLEVWGTLITLKWTVLGGTEKTLTANDCEIDQGGWPGLGSEANSTDVQFTDWNVYDTTIEYVQAAASLAQDSVFAEIDEEAMNGYGKCLVTDSDPECGVSKCNCSNSSEAMSRVSSASFLGPGDIVMPDCPNSDGENPTAYGGGDPNCACEYLACPPGGTSACGDCPKPFRAFWLSLSSRCLPDDNEVDEPNMCRGITYYYYSGVACL